MISAVQHFLSLMFILLFVPSYMRCINLYEEPCYVLMSSIFLCEKILHTASKKGVFLIIPPITGLDTIQQRRGQMTDKPVLLTGPGKVSCFLKFVIYFILAFQGSVLVLHLI